MIYHLRVLALFLVTSDVTPVSAATSLRKARRACQKYDEAKIAEQLAEFEKWDATLKRRATTKSKVERLKDYQKFRTFRSNLSRLFHKFDMYVMEAGMVPEKFPLIDVMDETRMHEMATIIAPAVFVLCSDIEEYNEKHADADTHAYWYKFATITTKVALVAGKIITMDLALVSSASFDETECVKQLSGCFNHTVALSAGEIAGNIATALDATQDAVLDEDLHKGLEASRKLADKYAEKVKKFSWWKSFKSDISEWWKRKKHGKCYLLAQHQELRQNMSELMEFLQKQDDFFRHTGVPDEICAALDTFRASFQSWGTKDVVSLAWEKDAEVQKEEAMRQKVEKLQEDAKSVKKEKRKVKQLESDVISLKESTKENGVSLQEYTTMFLNYVEEAKKRNGRRLGSDAESQTSALRHIARQRTLRAENSHELN